MGRNANPNYDKNFNQVLGLILIALGLLLAIALLSFDPGDIGFLREPPRNSPPKNYAGIIGAWLAYFAFLTLGTAAFLLPLAIIGVGLSLWIEQLKFLRHRWPWIAVLILTCCILLRHVEALFPSSTRDWVNALRLPSIGGFLGYLAYDYAFWILGRVGIWIVGTMLLAISLLYLSDYKLSVWAARLVEKIKSSKPLPQADKTSPFETKGRSTQSQESAPPQPEIQPTPRIMDTSVAEPRKSEILESVPSQAALTVQTETAVTLGKTVQESPAEIPIQDQHTKATPGSSKMAAPDIVEPVSRQTEPTTLKKAKRTETPPILPLGNYQLPPIDLLNPPPSGPRLGETKDELLANAKKIQQTLAEFGIEVAIGDITRGPTITRYELLPAPGVKLERISALSNNIAAALQAESIHVLAPIPGKASVGVEVPNRVKTYVYLRELLESDEWRNTRAKIPIALGKDVYGNPIIVDLAEMPHMLIAGSTGSGKSVCINAIVTSLLYRFPPDQLRFVMIDPKVVELQHYNALPHLIVPVITDPKKVILALRWVINEMEKRYQIFARVGVRNIQAFNERPKTQNVKKAQPELPLTIKRERIEPTAEGFAVQLDEEITIQEEDDLVIPDKLTYIVVIIDELADLMLVAPADVETHIARITQMARAAGIHCIVATQRPSVDVITGLIKANIAARIAFQCASAIDSRTILEVKGAEKLIGKGDMLFQPPGASKLIRAQGALVTDAEIERVVQFICKQAKPSYELDIHQQLQQAGTQSLETEAIDEDEELIQKCIEVILAEQKASVSLLQRRLRLGYTRAARIMDELERRGIVGPSKGAEPRDILISRPNYPQQLSQLPSTSQPPATQQPPDIQQMDRS